MVERAVVARHRVKVPVLRLEISKQLARRVLKGRQIEHVQFLSCDTHGQRVDVDSDDLSAKPGRLYKGRRAAHEWVADPPIGEVLLLAREGLPELLARSGRREGGGEQQRSDDGRRTPSPPLMHRVGMVSAIPITLGNR
jgi:hypothetical protein